MTQKSTNPYAALERIFHEPNRMAIVSSLCGALDGMTFTELKESCDLTDGNLNRHLKTLSEAGAVEIEKSFVRSKPQTRIFLSESGREGFLQYLKALESVLKKASRKAKAASGKKRRKAAGGAYARPAKA
jgi:DNA-binding transcriptional ArsR family regulator